MLRATSEMISTKYTASTAMEVIVETARTHALADSVVGVLREPVEGGDFLLVRGAADVKRLSPEEAAPLFSAAAHPRQKGGEGVHLAQGDDVILRFVDADRGLAYPIRAGDELVGALFFFLAPRGRHQTAGELPNVLLRHVIPQIETLYVLEQMPQARVIQERRRIARDLHDSFIQVLSALGLRLDLISAETAGRPGSLHQDLVRLRELVALEHRRVRAYVKDMREPSELGGSLRELIEHVVEPFGARTHLPVEVSISAQSDRLPGEVVRELAPLLREALTNVEKHARATRVSLTANLDGTELVVVIRDDGVGLSSSESPCAGPPGQGLVSMRERAMLLDGALEVKPGAVRGTELILSIPFHALPEQGTSSPLSDCVVSEGGFPK